MVWPFGIFTVGPFTGAGAAFPGAVLPLLPDVVSNTVLAPPEPRVAKIESDSEVIMNRIADAVVAFERRVADPRGPKAVCEPMPPNAPARSAAFPLCSNTTMIRKTQTITCTMVNSINIFVLIVYETGHTPVKRRSLAASGPDYTARALRMERPDSERAGFFMACDRRRTWSLTHTRNIGWRAFFSRSIMRSGASSR